VQPQDAPSNNAQPGPADAVLTYYHFQMTHKHVRTSGLVDWATGKAATLWANFGQAAEGNWKHTIHKYGERLVDRIDFEELALKTVDPSLGPDIPQPQSAHQAGEKGSEIQPLPSVPLVHPTKALPGAVAIGNLRTLLKDRVPKHRRRFLGWMVIAPLTIPFMLVPVIPNLPFFFCAWRSWSHFRAYRGARYLEDLVESGCVVPEADEPLERLCGRYTGLITQRAVPEAVQLLGLDKSANGELYRAIEQVKVRTRTFNV